MISLTRTSSTRSRIPLLQHHRHNNNNSSNSNSSSSNTIMTNHRNTPLKEHSQYASQQQQHRYHPQRPTKRKGSLDSTIRLVRYVLIVMVVIYFIIVILWTIDYIPSLSSSIFIILSSLLTRQQENNNDYELAKMESYGFFTDIDSTTWRRHQQHVHSAIYDETIYYNRSYPNDQADTKPAAWLMTNVQPYFTCPNLRRLGGHGDGAKWTCDPHRFVTKPDCLIYSFGSSGSYVFEDTIVSYSRHINKVDHNNNNNTCEIHVFDPEPSYARQNDAIQNNIHYHAWGLKSSRVHTVIETTTKKKYKFQWQWISQYQNIYEIIQLLGHEHRRIDVLKLDCEGCEWTTYTDWLFMTNHTKTMHHVDIRQILMETHGVPFMMDGGPEAFFNAMIQQHYVLFSKEANTHPGARPYGLFYEWSWLKLHPNFFV